MTNKTCRENICCYLDLIFFWGGGGYQLGTNQNISGILSTVGI